MFDQANKNKQGIFLTTKKHNKYHTKQLFFFITKNKFVYYWQDICTFFVFVLRPYCWNSRRWWWWRREFRYLHFKINQHFFKFWRFQYCYSTQIYYFFVNDFDERYCCLMLCLSHGADENDGVWHPNDDAEQFIKKRGAYKKKDNEPLQDIILDGDGMDTDKQKSQYSVGKIKIAIQKIKTRTQNIFWLVFLMGLWCFFTVREISFFVFLTFPSPQVAWVGNVKNTKNEISRDRKKTSQTLKKQRKKNFVWCILFYFIFFLLIILLFLFSRQLYPKRMKTTSKAVCKNQKTRKRLN